MAQPAGRMCCCDPGTPGVMHKVHQPKVMTGKISLCSTPNSLSLPELLELPSFGA